MMAQHEICQICRFWLPDTNSGEFDEHPYTLGKCRRYPAKVSDHMAAAAIGTPGFGQQYDPECLADSVSVNRACLLPVTFCTDWCGEFSSIVSEGQTA